MSSFNEEQGEKTEKEMPLSGRSYKGAFSIDTPSVRKDTLNHTIFINVRDSRGDAARFVSRHVLLKPAD